MVYVISKDGKPLMPCENVVARLLLKNGKAKEKILKQFQGVSQTIIFWQRDLFDSYVYNEEEE